MSRTSLRPESPRFIRGERVKSTTTLTPAASSAPDIEVLCDTRTPRERVLGSLVYKNFKRLILDTFSPSHVITETFKDYGFRIGVLCESFDGVKNNKLWMQIRELVNNPKENYQVLFRVVEIDIEFEFQHYDFAILNCPFLGKNVIRYEANVYYDKRFSKQLFLGVSSKGIEIHDYVKDEVVEPFSVKEAIKTFNNLLKRNIVAMEKIVAKNPRKN